MTDQNPIQIAVDAIVNCGPREDSTRIGSAGTVRRQAVDVSPLRRVNQAVALLTTGVSRIIFFFSNNLSILTDKKNCRHANQLSEMLRVLQNAWPMNLLM